MNINDSCKVELTESGLIRLQISGDPCFKHNLKGNALTLELWRLFSIFGPSMSMSSDQVFKNNEIKVKPCMDAIKHKENKHG